MRRALVLAGGGVAGIAWELGVLLGIRDEVPDLRPAVVEADVVVGTSAGSTVAAQITSGTDLATLFDRQLDPGTSEIEVTVDLVDLTARRAEATAGATSPQDAQQRIAAWALAVPTVEEATRRAVVAARLPRPDWPDRTVLVPAVDAGTGELTVFTRDSGVDLVDAVTASCAVPGIWPPATINGRRYVDGGVRSGTNADLAQGSDRVLVIRPGMSDATAPLGDLADEIERLRPAEVLVVHADEASVAAFGGNSLSPATRGPAARAGRAVGRARAADVARFWA
ncbi:patatin-like phospholipase family protein [Plantactinospora sp. CA-294935]|uniref:patatin-like phospholipase family protein n=1 Tax=Plantactinospora sp. CA-294935 TaxID=3240012 RepID=UPI003D916F8C